MTGQLTIGLFVKEPRPGHVKTRLGLEVGMKASAIFYAECIALLYERLRNAGHEVVIFVNESEEIEFFRDSLQITDSGRIRVQEGNDLGVKMYNALCSLKENQEGFPVILGSDSPTLPMNYIEQCGEVGGSTDVVLGPAEDGGYYLIATNTPDKRHFQGIEWSRPDVLDRTIQAIIESNKQYELLPTWNDVDTLSDLIGRTERFG